MLRNNVQKHIRMKHSEEEQSECPECGKCFKTTYNMKEHLRRYHGLGQRIAYWNLDFKNLLYQLQWWYSIHNSHL